MFIFSLIFDLIEEEQYSKPCIYVCLFLCFDIQAGFVPDEFCEGQGIDILFYRSMVIYSLLGGAAGCGAKHSFYTKIFKILQTPLL